MGALSHRALIRRMVNGAPNPPSIGSRRCQGTRLHDGYWTTKRDADGDPVRKPNGGKYDYERVWVEAGEEPCGSGCSIWVPELAWCAHHLPLDLIQMVGARAELWARLAADVWAEVLAEYPIPEHYLDAEEGDDDGDA